MKILLLIALGVVGTFTLSAVLILFCLDWFIKRFGKGLR